MKAKVPYILEKEDYAAFKELRFALNHCALTARIKPSGQLIDCNEKFLQVAGLAQEEIFKASFRNLLAEKFREFFSDNVLPVLARGIIWKGELCHRARNGSLYWSEATIVPILDSQDNVKYYQLLAFEVTERKAVETALTNNSLFFEKIMELAPIGFFLADDEGACTYINKMWESMSGCRLRQAMGTGWFKSVHHSDRDSVVEAWKRFVLDGLPFHCEYRYEQASGKITWVEAIAERLDFEMEANTRFIRVENDLTDRKESEKLISEQRAQIVASSKMSALGEMAGGIAHEINNPLAILQLRAMQIVQLTSDEAPHVDQLKIAAKNIHITTNRIAAIVRALRAISREGHGDPFVTTAVSTLISDTLALCMARFQSYSIRLSVTPYPDSLEIRCRAVEVLQILMNLLNNAFNAVEKLPEKWVEISVIDLSDSVEFWISDSGSGIPKELHEKIFQPFFTTKPIGSGTGLGLSICKAMALDHKGDLYVDDKCRHTRFVLLLPKDPLAKS